NTDKMREDIRARLHCFERVGLSGVRDRTKPPLMRFVDCGTQVRGRKLGVSLYEVRAGGNASVHRATRLLGSPHRLAHREGYRLAGNHGSAYEHAWALKLAARDAALEIVDRRQAPRIQHRCYPI